MAAPPPVNVQQRAAWAPAATFASSGAAQQALGATPPAAEAAAIQFTPQRELQLPEVRKHQPEAETEARQLVSNVQTARLQLLAARTASGCW